MKATPRGPDFSRSPFIVIWEVSQACDLACVHCRADARPLRSPLELTTEQGFRLIDHVAEFGSPLLVLTGGDPLKRDDLYDLISYAAGKGLRTAVSPSVTPLLTPEALRRFKEAGAARVAISLDGSTPRIHDSFRAVPGSFRRTVEALDECRRVGISLQINTTVTRHNFDDLPRIGELVAGFRPELWSVFFLVPTGRGRLEDEISAEEFEQAFAVMHETGRRGGFQVKSTEAPHYRRYLLQKKAMPVKERGGGDDPIGRAPLGINDGKGFVFISHTGEVYPSGFLPLSGGNVKRQSLVDIYRHSRLFTTIRDYSLLKGKCGVCEFRHVCGGSRARAYAVTGDYMESDPYCAYLPGPYREKASERGLARFGP